MHLRAGLGHTNHALEVTDGNGDGASRQGLATEVRKETSKLLLVEVEQLRPDFLPGEHDVFSEKVLWDHL